MTRETPLWMQNATYTAAADRRLVETIWSAGVMSSWDMLVAQRGAGANMSVDVVPGTAIVEGTAGPSQGRYLCHLTALENVALDPAPGTGQSRIDLIVATVRDSAIGGGDDDWILDAVTGTPTSGTPSEPTPPASSMVLARVDVSGGAASIKQGDITDRRKLAGSRVDQAALSIPPSFNGQIAGTTDGKLWVGSGGTWRWANEPEPAIVPDYPRVYQATRSSWRVKQTEMAVSTISVPTVPFDATLVVQSWCVAQKTGEPSTRLSQWIRTTVGGVSQDAMVQQVSLGSGPSSVPCGATRTLTAGQSATVQLRSVAPVGSADASNALTVVQVLPR